MYADNNCVARASIYIRPGFACLPPLCSSHTNFAVFLITSSRILLVGPTIYSSLDQHVFSTKNFSRTTVVHANPTSARLILPTTPVSRFNSISQPAPGHFLQLGRRQSYSYRQIHHQIQITLPLRHYPPLAQHNVLHCAPLANWSRDARCCIVYSRRTRVRVRRTHAHTHVFQRRIFQRREFI
jgi:hypothetical protein